jgi:hypothetical protein
MLKGKDLRKGYHSRAYHRYFEGWRERMAEDGNGKARIVREYYGDWYECGRGGLGKLLYAVLFVAASVLFGCCAVNARAANTPAMVFAQLLDIIALLYFGVSVALYITAKRRQTIGEWRSSSEGIRKSSLASAIALAVSSAAMLIYAEPLNTLGFLLAGGICFLAHCLEKRAKYTIVPNEKTVPSGSVEM